MKMKQNNYYETLFTNISKCYNYIELGNQELFI